MHAHAVLKRAMHDQTRMTLTGNAGSVGILVRVLHVFHKGLAAQEHLVTERTGGGVRAADQCCMLLQPTNTLLTKVAC